MNIVLEILVKAIRQFKKVKHFNQKGRNWIIFADDMIYVENSKYSTKIVTNIKFRKVSWYQMSTQISATCLCIQTMSYPKKNLKTKIKSIKYLGINLTKVVKNLHIENYNILIKEI